MSSLTIHRITKPADLLPALREFESLLASVETRAYHLFEQRGYQHGHDMHDWLEAEREILGALYTELSEDETSIQLRVVVSGFTPAEVTVIAAQQDLIVRAKTDRPRSCDTFDVKAMCHHRLPEAIDPEGLTAAMEDGMVRVLAPKLKARFQTAHP